MLDHWILPLAYFQQAVTAPGVDWLYQFTNNLTNLTTQNGGALSAIGLTLLAFISLFKLVRMVIDWNIATMTISLRAQPVRIGDLVEFMLQLILCLLILNYWVTPIPGAGFGFNHLFSYCAQVIVAALDQNSLTQLQSALSTALNNTPQPNYLAPLEILAYLLVYVFVGLAGGVLFLINCSSFIFYGVAALFGPVFVPLLMTRTFRGKFFHFVDVLLSFAMIRAVAAAFIFVWSGFLITFLQQTFNGDYSLPMWIANLYGVIAVFIAFILNMAMVPAITQTLFGGGSGTAGKVAQMVESLLVRAALVS
ncbi:MAG: type IV secretion system protein [Acidobacteriota bacterium]|nr:type IV secretion system protein [Acidobacteriota bacterium]